jgi:hypothetical protein
MSNKKRTAYFVSALASRSKFLPIFQKIADHLREKGFEVWDDVNKVTLEQARSFTDNEIKKYFTEVEKRIRNCDIFVAEISHNSLSVGYEIGYAIARSKPALILKTEELRSEGLGAPIRGNASKLINVHYYDEQNLTKEIDKFLRKAEKGIFVKRLPIEFTQEQVDHVQRMQLETGKSFNAVVRDIIQADTSTE